MNNTYHINEGQFYITNVCNLTCDRCITYNNRKFKGHFKWQDQESHYIEWSKKLSIESITIIGGEPFANPDLFNWVNGLANLWPSCNDRSVCTNGTYLSSNIDLAKEIIKKGFWLDLCVHDPLYYDEVCNTVKKIVKELFDKDITPILHIDRNKWAPESSQEVIINNQKIAKISKSYIFAKMATKSVTNRITYMHSSDPILAHDYCGPRFCHYFVRGNLYKCFLTAVSDDLIEQFDVENRAVDLLKKYKACSPWDDNIPQFMESLRNPIPQCSLCPEKSNIRPIWPLSPKKTDI